MAGEGHKKAMDLKTSMLAFTRYVDQRCASGFPGLRKRRFATGTGRA